MKEAVHVEHRTFASGSDRPFLFAVIHAAHCIEQVKSQLSTETPTDRGSQGGDAAPPSSNDGPTGECVNRDCTSLSEAQLLQVRSWCI